jgi:hypothetical protein
MDSNDKISIFFIALALITGFILGITSFNGEIISTKQVNIKYTKTVITQKDTVYVYSISDIRKQLKVNNN